MPGLLCFSLAEQRYALELSIVERVERAVALTPLPGAPRSIRGVFSLHGHVVPVGDLRRRLDLPDRDVDLDDHIVVTRSPARLLGVLTEGGTEIVDCTQEELVPTQKLLGSGSAITGIAHLKNGLVLIHDVARFLSLEEERALDRVLQGHAPTQEPTAKAGRWRR